MNKRFVILLTLMSAAVLISSCSSHQAMNVKIFTDPEGSHIIYRVAQDYGESDGPWIYLGITPYQGVTLMETSAFDDDDTITFRVMRHGYLDQVKQWKGKDFLDEYELEDMVFWAPRLVKAGK